MSLNNTFNPNFSLISITVLFIQTITIDQPILSSPFASPPSPPPPPPPHRLFLWGWLAGEFCPAANWCWCWVIMRGQTIGLDHRECWMISRGPGFLAVVWLAPTPPPHVFLSQSSCVLPAELTNGRGRGRGQMIRRREILVLYKSFNTLWSGQWFKKSRPAKLYN
jgi:hypothetical protein